MAGVLDRYRRFVVDGRPVATGVVAVGDAWACTNPSAGRGITVGLMHAQRLRPTVAKHAHDPEELALAWHAATEEHVTPFYRNQVKADTTRIAQMKAHQQGAGVPPLDESWALLSSAATKDADCFRGIMDMVYCLAWPEQVYARPQVAEAMARFGTTEPPPLLGPDRNELLALIS